MTCIPGRIRKGYTKEEYAGYKSQTVTAAGKKHRSINCEICGTSLPTGSYQSHLESQHDVFRSMVLQRDIMVDPPAVIYRAIKSLGVGTYFCPVPHCVGKARTKWALRWHFLHHHLQDLVVLLSEGTVPFPRCERCGMQTKAGALYGKHQRTRLCQEGWEKKKQHEMGDHRSLSKGQW